MKFEHRPGWTPVLEVVSRGWQQCPNDTIFLYAIKAMFGDKEIIAQRATDRLMAEEYRGGMDELAAALDLMCMKQLRDYVFAALSN